MKENVSRYSVVPLVPYRLHQSVVASPIRCDSIILFQLVGLQVMDEIVIPKRQRGGGGGGGGLMSHVSWYFPHSMKRYSYWAIPFSPRSGHLGTSQYSHVTFGFVVKHQGPSSPRLPGLRQNFDEFANSGYIRVMLCWWGHWLLHDWHSRPDRVTLVFPW